MMKPRHRDFMSVYCYIAVGALLGIIVGLVVGLIFGHVGFSMLAGLALSIMIGALVENFFHTPEDKKDSIYAILLSFGKILSNSPKIIF